MAVSNPNVGTAFGLVIGAGLATAIGASVVFFPWLVKLASRRVLAGALGVSAGVMTYVSFVEIFAKSQGSFQDAGYDEDESYIYATLCFFGGSIVMLLLDFLVKLLSGRRHHHHHRHDEGDHQHHQSPDAQSPEEEEKGEGEGEGEGEEHLAPMCCSSDPAGDLGRMQRQADEIANQGNVADATETTGAADDVSKGHASPPPHDENKKLVRMGVNTALAIGLHNFPEGLATFVAALDDPSVGAVLAIAIGIHNIPEGLCVAMPIYYATGHRWKAFGWALVSGASEPLAALLGWAILANSFSDELYAILFGFVAGMMVIISSRELLPTAHRYDPEDSVVTYSFIVGMVIMALSLVLFLL